MTDFPPPEEPSDSPGPEPTDSFTAEPTDGISSEPADSFTAEPTDGISSEPTDNPSPEPTDSFTSEPSDSTPTEELASNATPPDEPRLQDTPGAPHEPEPAQDPAGTPPPSDAAPPGAAHPDGPAPGYANGPPIRRVYRSRHDRRLGGVSAGIAEFFRIDPTIVRLATLVFAVTGIGILVYIAAWIIIPTRPEGYIEANPPTPIANERTMTLAFGVAAIALAFGIATGSWAVLAIALIGGGVWLLSEQTAMAPTTTAPRAAYDPMGYEPMAYAPTQPPQAAPAATPGAGYQQPLSYPQPPPTDWAASPPARKKREPQRVTWTVLSLLALLAAVATAAASGDWWDVSATRFVGIGLVTIGIGVVAGQLRGGGARGLIPLGILTALLLFPVSAVDGLLDDGFGEARYRPTSLAELEDTYEHGVGQLTVDLSALDFDGQSESVDIDLGIGELIVIVSPDTGGEAILQAKAGELMYQLPNSNSYLFEDGVNIETGQVTLRGENGTLDLDINVGLGTAELRSEGN